MKQEPPYNTKKTLILIGDKLRPYCVVTIRNKLTVDIS